MVSSVLTEDTSLQRQYHHNEARGALLRSQCSRHDKPHLWSVTAGLVCNTWHMSDPHNVIILYPGIRKSSEWAIENDKENHTGTILHSQRDLLNLSKTQSWNWLKYSRRWTLDSNFSTVDVFELLAEISHNSATLYDKDPWLLNQQFEEIKLKYIIRGNLLNLKAGIIIGYNWLLLIIAGWLVESRGSFETV